MVQPLWEKVLHFLIKLNTHLLYDPLVSFISVCCAKKKKTNKKTYIRRYISRFLYCSRMRDSPGVHQQEKQLSGHSISGTINSNMHDSKKYYTEWKNITQKNRHYIIPFEGSFYEMQEEIELIYENRQQSSQHLYQEQLPCQKTTFFVHP